jgi:hypothetical protein
VHSCRGVCKTAIRCEAYKERLYSPEKPVSEVRDTTGSLIMTVNIDVEKLKQMK